MDFPTLQAMKSPRVRLAENLVQEFSDSYLLVAQTTPPLRLVVAAWIEATLPLVVAHTKPSAYGKRLASVHWSLVIGHWSLVIGHW